MRHIQKTTNLGPRPLARPEFDLTKIVESDGETIRNLKLVAIHCGWLEYVGQNGETFRVEDGLI